MSYTHTVGFSWSNGSAPPISQSVSKSAGLEVNYDEQIPIANDQLVAMAIDVSQLRSMMILSDQNLTLETNSSSAADATINLLANEPLIWRHGTYFTNPLGATDVTALYVTNASAAAARLQIGLLIDPTV